jgi:hypothetical protein
MERPPAPLGCNECNEVVRAAGDAIRTALRLTLVARSAVVNGDLHRTRAVLLDLQRALQTPQVASTKRLVLL